MIAKPACVDYAGSWDLPALLRREEEQLQNPKGLFVQTPYISEPHQFKETALEATAHSLTYAQWLKQVHFTRDHACMVTFFFTPNPKKSKLNK